MGRDRFRTPSLGVRILDVVPVRFIQRSFDRTELDPGVDSLASNEASTSSW